MNVTLPRLMCTVEIMMAYVFYVVHPKDYFNSTTKESLLEADDPGFNQQEREKKLVNNREEGAI